MKVNCPVCKEYLNYLKGQYYCPNKKCKHYRVIQIGLNHGKIIEEE